MDTYKKILELVLKLVHIYGIGEKTSITYLFMCATVTTIVTI